MGKITIVIVGLFLLVVGYLFVKAGQSISSSIPSWFPYLGGIAGGLSGIGFWVILIGLFLIIVVIFLALIPRPSQRGLQTTSAPT